MNRKIELILSLLVCLLSWSIYEAKEYDDKFEYEATETTIQNYLGKVNQAQNLRKQIRNQLNLLNQLNSLSSSQSKDKYILSPVVASLKKTFEDLDTALEEFIPNDLDENELTNSFHVLKQGSSIGTIKEFSEDKSDANNSEELNGEQKMAKRQFDWFKRNMYPGGRYSKVPVIRTGK